MSHVTSRGCSRSFIVCVLWHAWEYVRNLRHNDAPVCFPFPEDVVQEWLLLAQRDCRDSYFQQDFFGGTAFSDRDTSTYWTIPAHFYTWWKNNIERKHKFGNLVKDALCVDLVDNQRVTFCREIVALALNIKNHFDRVINQNPGKPIVQVLLPTPLPEAMKHEDVATTYAFVDIDQVLDLKKRPIGNQRNQNSSMNFNTAVSHGATATSRGHRRSASFPRSSFVDAHPPRESFEDDDHASSPSRNLRSRRSPSVKAKEMLQSNQFFQQQQQQQQRSQYPPIHERNAPFQNFRSGKRSRNSDPRQTSVAKAPGKGKRRRCPYEEEDDEYVYSGAESSEGEDQDQHIDHYSDQHEDDGRDEQDYDEDNVVEEEEYQQNQRYSEENGQAHRRSSHYHMSAMSSDSECEDPIPSSARLIAKMHISKTTRDAQMRSHRSSYYDDVPNYTTSSGRFQRGSSSAHQYNDEMDMEGDPCKRRRVQASSFSPVHRSKAVISRDCDLPPRGRYAKGFTGKKTVKRLAVDKAYSQRCNRELQSNEGSSRRSTNPYGELSALELSKLVTSSSEKLAKSGYHGEKEGTASSLYLQPGSSSNLPVGEQRLRCKNESPVQPIDRMYDPGVGSRGRGRPPLEHRYYHNSDSQQHLQYPPYPRSRSESFSQAKGESGIAMLSSSSYHGQHGANSDGDDYDDHILFTNQEYDDESVGNNDHYSCFLQRDNDMNEHVGGDEQHVYGDMAVLDSFDLLLPSPRRHSSLSRHDPSSNVPPSHCSVSYDNISDDRHQDQYLQRSDSTTSILSGNSCHSSRSQNISQAVATPMYLDQIMVPSSSHSTFPQIECSPLPQLPNDDDFKETRDSDHTNGDSFPFFSDVANSIVGSSLTSAITTSSSMSVSDHVSTSTKNSPLSVSIRSELYPHPDCPPLTDCRDANSQSFGFSVGDRLCHLSIRENSSPESRVMNCGLLTSGHNHQKIGEIELHDYLDCLLPTAVEISNNDPEEM